MAILPTKYDRRDAWCLQRPGQHSRQMSMIFLKLCNLCTSGKSFLPFPSLPSSPPSPFCFLPLPLLSFPPLPVVLPFLDSFFLLLFFPFSVILENESGLQLVNSRRYSTSERYPPTRNLLKEKNVCVSLKLV